MKKLVKITTIDWILDWVFPCYCKGCGKIGEVLCRRCIFYNIRENKPFFAKKDKDFHRIFACGERTGVLSELISQYKFSSRRHYRKVLAEYLFLTLRKFGEGEKFVLVPLPTISKHIRERGFDHIKLLVEELSEISGFRVMRLLRRRNRTVQVGATAEKRVLQAREAYEAVSEAEILRDGGLKVGDLRGVTFLLLDDVWTTGASTRAAREVLFRKLVRQGWKKEEVKISAICLAKNSGRKF